MNLAGLRELPLNRFNWGNGGEGGRGSNLEEADTKSPREKELRGGELLMNLEEVDIPPPLTVDQLCAESDPQLLM